MKRLFALASLFASLALAQSPQPGVDYPSPIPVPFIGFTQGSADPSHCVAGLSPLNFRTDLVTFRFCSSRDTWSTLDSSNAAVSGSNLSIAAGKVFTLSNTLTLAGTDATTMTFPSTSATVARTDAANTFTGHQTLEGVTSTGATGTGNIVFSAAPTLTGLLTAGSETLSSTLGVTGAITPTGGVAQALTTVPYSFFNTFQSPVALTSVTDVVQEWYSQIFIPTNVTLTGACLMVGSSVATDKMVVFLANQAGTIVANSELTNGTTIAGTSVYQCLAFSPGTYAAQGPQTYYVGVQTSGTHATELTVYPTGAAPTNYGTGIQAAGSFKTLVNIATPATTFSANVGPVMAVY